ncbi:MAG: rhomboid family intramembrane serine protease [Bacteroidia bacterium]
MFNFIIKLIDAMVWPLLLTVLIWIMFFLNHGYHLEWNFYGLRPMEFKGLIGIVSMPFLHGNFDHLFSNTIPLLLSMSFIFLYFKEVKWNILAVIYLGSGFLLWFIAHPKSNHIGASGLVYGYIAFMVTHAFLTKNKHTIAAAMILIFLYGSLVYGIFPEYGKLIGKNISWEGHLSGLIIGIVTALLYRKKGPQRIVYFPDEDEEEDHDDDDSQPIDIYYHYTNNSQDPLS